ncbi:MULTISPECIES: GNAT family N-acetyltransferase [Clostridium]|uniref:GNAT family N-acetyltransferase n=1 Tax=Clostridium cibarium TaxID=2762247 RepID=A0ABR8PNK5_9CLOT|nr:MULTISPECIES: GNAT family N-acetyltransferase [Clostridium]MBD7909751.1 GNAT family N-acetyltransferase [Clostridium cibarium]
MVENKDSYRRNGKKIYIKQPDFKEFTFISRLWSDEETMKEIGGVFNFPEDKWEMFYKKMVYPTDGKNFYCLVYTIRDKAIGEVSFHGYDSATKIARFNLKIHHRYRNKGYGEEALRLLFEYYFLEFGGEMIIDSIPTETGVRIAKKLGFQEVGQYKDGIKMKITKEEFLDNRIDSTNSIGILMYDGMSIMDYGIICESLEMANEIKGKKLFSIVDVALKNTIKFRNGTTINVDIIDFENYKPDVLIIPGGEFVDSHVKDKEIIKYIMMNLNHCDYICTQGEGIKFLIRCRALEGIRIPKLETELEGLEEDRIVDKNFVDNGKVILSANTIGSLEMILSLVEKIGGRKLSEELESRLGLVEKNFIKEM